MSAPILRRFALLVPLLLLGAEISAQAKEVRFDEVIATSEEAPRVRAAAASLAVRRKADRSLPSNRGPLTLTLAPGHRLNPSEEAGTELSLAITQGWNLSDLSGRSRRAAKAERDVLTAEWRARALASRVEAARRWFQLHQAEAALTLVREELSVVAELDAVNRRAREAGLVTAIAEAEASTAHAEAKRLELALEGERVEAALALSVALGAEPDPELKTAGALPAPALPAGSRIAELLQRVEHLPQVALRRLQSVASLARAAEAKASKGRTVSFGLQAARESSGSALLFGTLGLTLPGANKGQRQRAILRAEAAGQRVQADRMALALRAQMADAVHELEHSEELWQLISTRLAPSSESLLAKRERELELGEGTILEVLRARARVLAAKRYAADADAERRWAQVHVWLLLAEIELADAKGEMP